MAEALTIVSIAPVFDAALYRQVSGAGDSGGVAATVLQQWDRLVGWLRGYRCNRQPLLPDVAVFYLESQAETLLAETWNRSALHGWQLHNLAVTAVMSAAGDAIPEIRRHGCAPVPAVESTLRQCLAQIGQPLDAAGNLPRQYADMTFMPYAGGCEVCRLRDACPKKRFPGTPF